MLNSDRLTFVLMHIDTIPAKNVPTKRHLRRDELLVQTNAAIELVSRFVYYLLDLLPLVFSSSFEVKNLLSCNLRGIDQECQSPFEALLFILCVVPAIKPYGYFSSFPARFLVLEEAKES